MSVILLFLECSLVLLYALLVRHFYHSKAFRDFYVDLPSKLGLDKDLVTFDHLIVIMTVALSVALPDQQVLPPKSNLFSKTSAATPEIEEISPPIEKYVKRTIHLNGDVMKAQSWSV